MRLLFQILSQLVLAAIALIIVHLSLPGVEVSVSGFLVAIAVFTIAHAILGPFVLNLAQRYAAPLAGGVGLIATMLALWVATLFPGGISIHGLQAWILAPIIVWFVTALGGWLFMAFVIDKWLKRRAARKLLGSAQA